MNGILWPWAEQNQGLLSLLALIVALLIALFENKRANDHEIKRRKKSIDAIIEILKIDISLAENAIEEIKTHNTASEFCSKWLSNATLTREIFEKMGTNHIDDSSIAINIVKILWEARSCTNISNGDPAKWKTRLEGHIRNFQGIILSLKDD